MKIKKTLILFLAIISLISTACGNIGTTKEGKINKISSAPYYKNVKEYLTKRLEVPLEDRYESGKINNIYEYNYKVFDNNIVVVPLDAIYKDTENPEETLANALMQNLIDKLGTIGDEYFQFKPTKENKKYEIYSTNNSEVSTEKVSEYNVRYFTIDITLDRVKEGGVFNEDADGFSDWIEIGVIEDENYAPNKNVSAFAILDAGYLYGLTDESCSLSYGSISVNDFIASLNGIKDNTSMYRLSNKKQDTVTKDKNDTYCSTYYKKLINDTLGIDFSKWYKDSGDIFRIDNWLNIPIPKEYEIISSFDYKAVYVGDNREEGMRIESISYYDGGEYINTIEEFAEKLNMYTDMINVEPSDIKIGQEAIINTEIKGLRCGKTTIEVNYGDDAEDFNYITVYRFYTPSDNDTKYELYISSNDTYGNTNKEKVSNFFDSYINRAIWLGDYEEASSNLIDIISDGFRALRYPLIEKKEEN